MKHIMMGYKGKKQTKAETLNVRYLNGKARQLLALILGGSLIFGMTGAGAYAAGMQKGGGAGPEVIEAEEETTVREKGAKTTEGSVEETVYVIAGADGTTEKVIVSDWMKGEDGEDTYTQENLEKELPVEMAVSFRLDGNKMTAEEMAGKSGKVTMRFDYTNRQYEDVEIGGEKKRIYVPFVMVTGMVLDNERFTNVEVSNGKVINDGDRTIVAGFAVPGLQESLELDREKMELPDYVEVTADVKDFALETTMTLATTEVFGDLDMDQTDSFEELDESMEELTDAMGQLTDGSSALYDGLSELLDKSGELTDGIGQLHSGAEALATGAGTLVNGAGDLKDGAGDLKNGAGELKAGVGTLKDGAETLKSGTETLETGAGALKDGLGQLAANNDTLNGGAGQVFDSLLAAANAQIQASGLSLPALTRDNYGQVLEGALGTLNEGVVREQAMGIARQKVEAKVREQTGEVRTGVEAVVRQQVLQGVLAAAGMDEASYQALRAAAEAGDADATAAVAGISSAMDAQMGSGEIQGKISQATEAKIQELIAQNMQSEDVAKQIEAAVTAAKTGAASLSALKSQLDSYNQFYEGLLAYTAGVALANDGAGQLVSGAGELAGGAGRLVDGAGELLGGAGRLEAGAGQLEAGAGQLLGGAGQLSDGADSLYVGVGRLKSGSGALIDGVGQLADGAGQLSDGVKKLDEEGIQVLVDAFDGDLKELKERMTAVTDAAKQYRSFKDSTGNRGEGVRFLYKTGKIGEE